MIDGECGLNDDNKLPCKISESGKVFLILIRLFVGRLYNRRDALSRPNVEHTIYLLLSETTTTNELLLIFRACLWQRHDTRFTAK